MHTLDTLKVVSDIIGHLAWPFVVLILAGIYKKPLTDLLHGITASLANAKISTLKAFGVELSQERDELQTDLKLLDGSASAALADVSSLALAVESREPITISPQVAVNSVFRENASTEPITNDPSISDISIERKILEEAIESPKIALIRLGREIEREAMLILGGAGRLSQFTSNPLLAGADYLASRSNLTTTLNETVQHFAKVRNSLVHGLVSEPDDVLRGIDSGLKILRSLQEVPRDVHWIHIPEITLFSDENCTNPRNDIHGVTVISTLATGQHIAQIFPTRRSDYFAGQRVAYEFDPKKSWGPSWYRDTDPNKDGIFQAWVGECEFIGLPIS